MTETVTVTPPPLVVNVPVPPDTFDFWHDIILTGDFFGAVLAVLGGIAAGVVASRMVVRADRQAREEDNRRTLALEFADAARALSKQLFRDAKPEVQADALERYELLVGRLVRLYAQHPQYDRYARWLSANATSVGVALMPMRWAMREPSQTHSETRKIDDELNEFQADLRVIEHTTLEWIRLPDSWKPDESARLILEGFKKLRSRDVGDEPAESS